MRPKTSTPRTTPSASGISYHIHNARSPSVFERHFAWHYPQPLDAAAMHAAAQCLIGRHDFSSFETAGSERPRFNSHDPRADSWPRRRVSPKRRNNVRTDITIDVAGDGFLYNMVRTIVGTLVEVGIGKQVVAWPAEVLAAQDRRRAGQTAPPQGLFLVRVDYESYSRAVDSEPIAKSRLGKRRRQRLNHRAKMARLLPTSAAPHQAFRVSLAG